MLSVLRNVEPKRTEMLLSTLMRTLLPDASPRSKEQQYQNLSELEREILREIGERLGLAGDLPSKHELPAVLDFLSREVSNVVLSEANIEELQAQTFDKGALSHEPTRKPKARVFIGSSTEGLGHAYALQRGLEFEALTEIWTEQSYTVNYALEHLIRDISRFDFAAFVLTSDDLSSFRGRGGPSRSNLAFEAGLFVGRLGASRTFFLLPQDQPPVGFLSDLAGILTLSYESSISPTAIAVQAASHEMAMQIRRFGPVGSKQPAGAAARTIQNTVSSRISLPSNFKFGETRTGVVAARPGRNALSTIEREPDLGPLAAFVGNWNGNGFNAKFRPNSSITPTALPIPVPPGDNILELSLTREELSFSPSLGSVPNRATTPQRDTFLNGVPYLQTIQDVTTHGRSIGIHAEVGLWMSIPPTDDPAVGPSLVRMGSIPHGTTIQAQGTSLLVAGPPLIAATDITPFVTGVTPQKVIKFPSQTASAQGTPRIPQDLTSFIASGTITQAMLDDPNTFLRNQISQQTITATTVIVINTNPAAPLFGGGTNNIAFLQGDPSVKHPNASVQQVSAIFWIETVQLPFLIQPSQVGRDLLILQATPSLSGQAVPVFYLQPPPVAVTQPVSITLTYTQIQYSQLSFVNFAGLTWPQVSVATLVPADPIFVPASVWRTV